MSAQAMPWRARRGKPRKQFPSCPPEDQPPLIAAMKGIGPVCTLGFNLPGTAFTLSTGWGWVTAATNHLKMARELMETGSVASANYNFPEKHALINQPFYDGLIREWAEKTGRPTREKSAIERSFSPGSPWQSGAGRPGLG